MKRTIFSILATMFVLLGAQLPAVADVGISVEFSDEEVRIIGAWYEEHDSRAGHGGGKSKHKGLPPGIAKNLARGKPLPPGIAKQRLPDGLLHALPSPPRGYERIIVDGKVLLVEIATQVIHDILTDIVLR
ncbi:MAG: anti-virulence regulator CigR family protein [Gammaproteobacteria bacterium]|jgi:Ni/Co efflux regulator RcnB|nr:anti-virulence regulator CigR family protein [Gammaproteobacteria bacterium]MDH3848109.1 anti-virulence regulator CigR family protein [Gammaproteobacteria bacterium]MDH3865067.1 anti-virulence regulator CigR family protein [Gammaproteobacteria bacterium]MDH3907104.1 anti-virulence regulator CigR family protein [Gammaproteobacteria bacterium]MDH4005027.1 anti-virulence regulator CigR family protein [Gammaproteobacteria bacterium]